MKKLYTTPEYKSKHRHEVQKAERRHSQNARKKGKKKKGKTGEKRLFSRDKIYAPTDFRLIDNTEECLLFLRDIRSEESINHIKNNKIVIIALDDVEKIDYGMISALSAISDDLKFKRIVLRGNFPIDETSKQFLIDSAFLDRMVNNQGHKFPKSPNSELIFFEKGCGVLSTKDSRKITNLVKNVVKHLTGEQKHFKPVKTVLLEICGNSIEWANSSNKQWLLGVKYEQDKVVFTVTDVGKGILETLYRKFPKKVSDFFVGKSDSEILKGAFDKKYSSSSAETNRNKGLPSVKVNFEQAKILGLKVLTNNVILHFDNEKASRTLKKGAPRFRGTFYQWELTKNCLAA